jgi:hypothetical protein
MSWHLVGALESNDGCNHSDHTHETFCVLSATLSQRNIRGLPPKETIRRYRRDRHFIVLAWGVRGGNKRKQHLFRRLPGYTRAPC